MVGRHAQMIPTLTSTLDQIIEGVTPSEHVSAREKYTTDI